jgi:hypothetical protein
LTAASAQTTKSIAVIASEAVITLDGRLDEPVWRDAAAVLLVQQSPKPGEPTPYITEVSRLDRGRPALFRISVPRKQLKRNERA